MSPEECGASDRVSQFREVTSCMKTFNEAELVRQILEQTCEIVTGRIRDLEKGLAELDEALESAAPQNPMEDDSYRENLAEERLHLQGSLARKEALLLHLKRMPGSCEAGRVRAGSVVFTADRNVLVIVSEADGEFFEFGGRKVSLMSVRAPLFERIRDLHAGDAVTWKNGRQTTITAVC